MAERKFNPLRSIKGKPLMRRTGDLVLLNILQIIGERDNEGKPARYTHIMFSSGTNPFVCNRYLEFCKEHGLIEVNNKTYHLTAKGLAILNALKKYAQLKEEVRRMERELLERIYKESKTSSFKAG